MSTSFSSSSVTAEERKRKRNETVTSDTDDTDSESSDEQARDPILSHAENRRKKKRKLKDGTTFEAVDRPDGSATTSTLKRQNSVWVGNLSYKTQQDDLRMFFKGVVGEITRIHMPTKKARPAMTGDMKPENRGFAYVDFATPESKSAAVSLSEQPLLGRKLLIKDGDNFEGRPGAISGEAGGGGAIITDPIVIHKTRSKTAQKILACQKQPAGPTLFFGNLPFETTEDEIWQLLDAHRQRISNKKKKTKEQGDDDDDERKEEEEWIRKIRMGTFEDSGLCKGFAFVDFTSIDNATAALINPRNHHLNGRDLAVEYAGPDAVRRGASKDLQPSAGVGLRRKRRPLSAGYKKTRGRKKPSEEEASVAAAVAVAAEAESGTSLDNRREHPPRREKDSKFGNETKSATTTRRGASEQKATILGRERSLKSRPKPGAALALAKRETVAIVPSQGKKIVF